MVAALLVVGALATPVTGLFVRPDVRGARHGTEMFIDLGRLGWYGYLVIAVAGLAVGLAGVASGTPRGARFATGAATALLVLTLILGSVHVFVVTTGVFHGTGRPLPAAAAAVAEVGAASALVLARVRLRR